MRSSGAPGRAGRAERSGRCSRARARLPRVHPSGQSFTGTTLARRTPDTPTGVSLGVRVSGEPYPARVPSPPREPRMPPPDGPRPSTSRPYASRRPAAPDRLSGALRYRRALTLVLMSALVPGTAQLVAGNRRVGRLALRAWAVLVALGVVVLVLALASSGTLVELGVRPAVLTVVRIALVLLSLAWLALLVDAWRLGSPGGLESRQRTVATGLAAVLALALCGPMLWAAHLAGVQRDLITSVFAEGSGITTSGGRLNVLLLGGDAGRSRTGTRPDSITLVSVDVETGRSVMFSLPRNLERARFPVGTAMHAAFPEGFDDMLNAVYTYGSEHAALFPGARNPGVEATRQAVAGTLGLPVHHYVLVNLGGFRKVIDALGGIRIDVEARIPIGGGTSPIRGWIEPGRQRLDGYSALWYARSREGSSDYVRMARQRCVMGAMLAQADPLTVLSRFRVVADSAKGLLETDLPQRGLADIVDLALRARTAKVTSVQFVPPLIRSGRPDVGLIQARVRTAIGAAAKGAGKRDAAPRTAAQRVTAAAAAPQATAAAAAPQATAAAATPDVPAAALDEICSYG